MPQVTSDLMERRWNELDLSMKDLDIDVTLIYGKGIITQYGYLHYFSGYYPVLRPGFVIYANGSSPIAYYNTRADSYLAGQAGFIKDNRYVVSVLKRQPIDLKQKT